MENKLKEARRKAWETRRAKYGAKGHNGYWKRNIQPWSGRIQRMEDALIRLYGEAILSEGQVSSITGLGRIECRRRAQEMGFQT